MKEFTTAALDENAKTFVVYVATLSATSTMQIHLLHQPQVGFLLANKTLAKISPKYSNYADIFSFDLAIELFENTGIYKHTIKLVEGKQPPYGPIYILGLVELETLKTYIETNLKTGFIQPFKFPVGAPIVFNQKPDRSFHFWVDY